MELGVQTHFSQNWNTAILDKIAALGVTEIRDSQPWATVEKTTGSYVFTPTLTNYMAQADNRGIGALLTFASANTLYDSGYTPYTAAGRQAYANYIVTVLKKYPGQVQEIEIWNEFNTGNFTGPAGSDSAAAYTALLKTVWETVKPLFPDVQILGGSTNVIGVGALEAIFKLGALNYMDGVAVHPYRSTPEHVDDELAHLQAVMANYGAVKPIYATEFGNQFANANDVPDFMLKDVTLMASVGVKEAFWYAAIDQSFYANMGLFTTSGEAKPAAAAFAFIESNLLPLGNPVRIDTGDDMTLVYRYGADTYVMWSSGRSVSFGAGGTFYNSKGEKIAAPTELTMTPVIFKGASYALGASNVVADSLMQFNEGEWRYYAKDAKGVLTPLTNVDWDWTSYLGSKYTKPLRVNADSIAPAGTGANPIQVVERYVSDKDQTIAVKATWTTGAGDGVDLHVLVNGKEILVKVFQGTFSLDNYQITLKAGDTLDFAMGPNQTVEGDSTSRRIVLTKVDTLQKVEAVAQVPVGLTLAGTTGADTLTGGANADRLNGLAGNDKLTGGAGDDVLSGGSGKNILDGSDGFDIASYADATSAVKVLLTKVGYQYPNADRIDSLVSIEGLIGSNFNDTLTGGAGDNKLYGGAGDDVLVGGGGADLLDGGAGKDTVSFETATSGVTISLATTAAQAIGGGSLSLVSIDRILGSAYADRLTANDLGSELNGGAGNDFLFGGAGNDFLIGGVGIDTVSYERATAGVTVSLAVATAQATGGAGVDTIISMENLTGSAFADKLYGDKMANGLQGGAGNDILVGGVGADILSGGLGKDTFVLTALGDSKAGGYDTITDFSHAQGDRIDLSLLDASTKIAGDNAFSLVSAFTHVAGQLISVAETGGYFVQGDVNGDGFADFGLHVVTSTQLVVSDFIL